MPHRGVENRALSASSRSATSMNVSRLVVVGASLAGLRAVEAARKAGFEGAITLIGAERHLPYDRPPLSKDFLDAAKPDAEELIPFFRSDDVFADELRLELLLGAPATGLDIGRKVVLIGDREVGYDALIIATGSQLRTLPGSEHLDGRAWLAHAGRFPRHPRGVGRRCANRRHRGRVHWLRSGLECAEAGCGRHSRRGAANAPGACNGHRHGRGHRVVARPETAPSCCAAGV